MQKLYFSLSFILIAIATDLCATITNELPTSKKVASSNKNLKINKIKENILAQTTLDESCVFPMGSCVYNSDCCQYPGSSMCCGSSDEYTNRCLPKGYPYVTCKGGK